MEEKTIVYCPICGNRLFDVVEKTCHIEIKCTKCKNIVNINTFLITHSMPSF